MILPEFTSAWLQCQVITSMRRWVAHQPIGFSEDQIEKQGDWRVDRSMAVPRAVVIPIDQQHCQEQQQQQRRKKASRTSIQHLPFLHFVACIFCIAFGFGLRLAVSSRAANMGLYSVSGSSTINATRQGKVGRHEIFVRAHPHPNWNETKTALGIINKVQLQQWRVKWQSRDQTRILAITPYDPSECPGSALQRLQTLANTLSLVQSPLLWIIVQRAQPSLSAEFQSTISQVIQASGVEFRYFLEPIDYPHLKISDQLRLEGLRFVSMNKLQGVIMFADDYNLHSLDLFEVVAGVSQAGAFQVAFPVQAGGTVDEKFFTEEYDNVSGSTTLLNYPSCDRKTGKFTIDQQEALLPHWDGFVFRSDLLWNITKSKWMDRNAWIERWWTLGPFHVLTSTEILGKCGKDPLVWRNELKSSCSYHWNWTMDVRDIMDYAADDDVLAWNRDVGTTEGANVVDKPVETKRLINQNDSSLNYKSVK